MSRAEGAGGRGPRRISESLGEAARRAGVPGAAQFSVIEARWEEIVGPEIAANAWPVKLVGDVLSIATAHPAWAAELRLLSAQLVEHLQAVLGPAVATVTVQVSSRTEPEW